MTRKQVITSFLFGTVVFPVASAILGYKWQIVLLSVFAGGPLMVAATVRHRAFRDIFHPRQKPSGGDPRDLQVEPEVSQVKVTLVTMAVLAGVATAIAFAFLHR